MTASLTPSRKKTQNVVMTRIVVRRLLFHFSLCGCPSVGWDEPGSRTRFAGGPGTAGSDGVEMVSFAMPPRLSGRISGVSLSLVGRPLPAGAGLVDITTSRSQNGPKGQAEQQEREGGRTWMGDSRWDGARGLLSRGLVLGWISRFASCGKDGRLRRIVISRTSLRLVLLRGRRMICCVIVMV